MVRASLTYSSGALADAGCVSAVICVVVALGGAADDDPSAASALDAEDEVAAPAVAPAVDAARAAPAL